jgi:hypothetical protein
MRSAVVLPQPEGPTEDHELAVRHAAVDHELAIRTENGTGRRGQFDVAPHVPAERTPAQLEGAEALFDHARGKGRHFFRRLGHHLAGVDFNLRRRLSSE